MNYMVPLVTIRRKAPNHSGRAASSHSFFSMFCLFILLIPALTLAKDIAQPAPRYNSSQSSESLGVIGNPPRTNTEKKKARREKAKKRKEKQAAGVKTTETPGKGKTLKSMSFAELKASKDQLMKANDKQTATKYLEKMLPLADDLNERRDLTLELADTYFDIGELEKAGKMYKEFSTMYPSSGKVEVATYKAVLCSFYATLEADRDQTKTEDTIELATNFLDRAVFTTYAKDVKEILGNCRKKLFDNQLIIVKDYINRGRLTSAKTRIKNIRTQFATLIPDSEPELLLAECSLAERQNNAQLLAEKQKELATKFPNFVQTLASAQPKRSFLSRF